MENNTNRTLWVAIEVAKSKHDALIEYPNGTQKQLKIMNNLNDFKRLATYLNKESLIVIIGLEASGYYHRPIAYFLLQQKFEIKLISSSQQHECVKHNLILGIKMILRTAYSLEEEGKRVGVK